MKGCSRKGLARRLAGEARGTTAVEYGLIISLIGVATSLALITLGNRLSWMWTSLATTLGIAT